MMKNVLPVLPVTTLCWLVPAIGLANGGGYASGVGLTGTVAPFVPQGTERVQIADEKLEILLTPGGASVTVHYMMRSTAAERVSVTFGFPVERVKDPNAEAPKRPQTQPKHLRGYAVRLDGQPVKATYRRQRYGKQARGEPAIVRSLRRIEGWMISTIDFGPRQSRRLSIRYTSAYDQRGEYISDDDHSAPSIFRYRLSTGAVWHGPIARGRVTVRTLGIHLPWVRIKRPVNRFRRQGEAWSWSFTGLEPTLADDLEIHARPKLDRYGVYGDNAGRRTYYTWNRKAFYLAHRDYRVKASSELPATKRRRYPAANLKRSEKQPWCEGVEGPGVGQSIEIVPTQRLPLLALELLPGHHRSKALFARNNRPASLEIVLNGSHRFTAALADEPLEHLLVVEGYREPVKKIELVIKEVYKGSKYDDTCIAQLKLVSRLPAPPKHYGAR